MGSIGTSSATPKLPESSKITDETVKELRNSMGQTGNEAGDPFTNPNSKLYANSGKAFNINAYLNSDGATIHSDLTDWDKYISKTWVKNAIKQMDNGMKPLTQSVNVTRFLSKEGFEAITGVKYSDDLISQLQAGGSVGKDLSSALSGVNYVHKGYTSTSYKDSHPSYGDQPVALNMVLRQGTHAIVTNNTPESEIIAARGSKYNFTGGYSIREVPVYQKIGNKGYGKQIGTRKQLVLDVYI